MINISKTIINYNIPIFDGKKIIHSVSLSKAFGSFCEKIQLNDNSWYVVKGTQKKQNNYNSIFCEGKSLDKMHKYFPDLFPKIFYLNKNFFVMKYIKHNKIKSKSSEKDFAYKIAKIHLLKNDKFGVE